MDDKNYLKGGAFITKSSDGIFIPEEFDEEQKMIAGTCDDFLEKEVQPILDVIDSQKPGLMRELITKTGELGLLGISVPEEYNGFGQSFITSMLTSDRLGAGFSYAVAYSAHTGIGTLPILYYGNEEQKQKYLPKLATGEFAGAYCLTEPNAGSDANSGKTRAVLSADGTHYKLNGQKMWITNGGFADVFTVFAKIDDDRILSAFIVERTFPGISFGAEEHKMGIKGSSTVQIFFNDCEVPVDNLLGKRGEGFRIALNILHIGRIKLGANVLGACRYTINKSVAYANERKQFGSKIAAFGAIQHKLAEQVIKLFAVESAVYRTSKYIDDTIDINIQEGKSKGQAYLEAIGEYAMEAAILKVFASESQDYIVDEAVQIHGGMGFSAEMPVDRCYRDSRINRIFEGTNEINRMVCADMMLKQAKKADSSIFSDAAQLYVGLDNVANEALSAGSYFDYYLQTIVNLKKTVLLIMGRAYETLGKQYSMEQEVQMNISDMLIQVYAAESIVLRVKKLEQMKGAEAVQIYKDILDVFVYEAAASIRRSATDAVSAFAEGEEYTRLKNAVESWTMLKPVNIKNARRRIAAKLIEDNLYSF
ncbi:MAG TPA: acyl-CoA dehydrogenase family protein [Bacteroidales bacterium]|nr:acyl-CoA dehydrogenase family protein [Bacteroidales bacterium]